jgi:hypothetical protein
MESARPPGDIPVPLLQIDRLRRLTEIAANIVIVCAVIFCAIVWLHHDRTSSPATACGPSAAQAPLPGTPVTLPGVDWRSQASTLVVAISSACPHCLKESSFYSEITRTAHRVPIFVVMPQPKQAAQSFLDEHDIKPSGTISDNLRDMQVQVTPTLLLVSSSGVVKQTWVGELDARQRLEVLRVLDHL